MLLVLRSLAYALLIITTLQISTNSVSAQEVSKPQASQLEAFEAKYQKINQSTDLYERLEWAEKLESQLNGYIKVHSDHPQALLLRAKLKLTLVAIQSERGAAAIDYWAFISDVVDPIRYAALADLQSVLKHTSDTKLIAETHYFLAQYYFAADEADQALIDQELKTACDGDYQKACQNLK